MTGLRQKKKEEKRQRILTSASELFDEKGYGATTTREIAERAGVGTGTVFVYFREKRDLLFHVFRLELDPAIDEAFASLPSGALVERIEHLLHAIFRHYERRPELGRQFVKELLFLDAELRSEMMVWTLDFLQRLAVLLEESKARGELAADAEPMPVAMHIFALYFQSLAIWLGGGLFDSSLRDHQLRSMLVQLMRGVGPREE